MSMAALSGVAVVTGGASGIGAACCRELAARGARIALLDRDERVHGVAREVNGRAWVVDVADEAALARCADSIETELGPVEMLVNSAGVIQVPLPPSRKTRRWGVWSNPPRLRVPWLAWRAPMRQRSPA